MTIRGEINNIVGRRARAVEAYNTRMGALNGGLQRLQEAVVSGESTVGDPIADFVFVTRGVLGEAEQPYRDLEARLAGNVGQLILIVTRTPQRTMSPSGWGIGESCPQFRGYVQVSWYLGVLDGEKLLFEYQPSRWGLPVSRSVLVGETIDDLAGLKYSWHATTAAVSSGPFWLGLLEHPMLEEGNRLVNPFVKVAGERRPKLEVEIGDERVLVRDDGTPGRLSTRLALRQAARSLSVAVEVSTEEQQYLDAVSEEARKQLKALLVSGRTQEPAAARLVATLTALGHPDDALVVAYRALVSEG